MSQLSFSLGALFFKILDRFEILLGASSVFSISFCASNRGRRSVERLRVGLSCGLLLSGFADV
jgi:hypothetical protein